MSTLLSKTLSCFCELLRVSYPYAPEEWTETTYRSSGFTSNRRFIATELFRRVRGLHSSGNFKDTSVKL